MPFFLAGVPAMKKIVYWFLILISLFVGLWIAQDNPDRVVITLLGFPLGNMSAGLWLLLAFAAGILIGLCATLPLLWRLTAANRALRREQVAPR